MIEPQASSSVIETLGINGKLLLAQLINFGIVVFVMWRWVYKPLMKMMDERAKEIAGGLKNAKEAELQLSSASSEKEALLNAARAEAHAILEDGRTKSEEFRKQKLVETKSEIEKIAVEAKAQMKQEREATFAALKGDIADLVALSTAKVASEFDEKTHRSLIEKAIKQAEKTEL